MFIFLLFCVSGEDPRKHRFFRNINLPRLEAGLLDPPWVPKTNVVYAKDTEKFVDFSKVDGVEFDEKDEKFFEELSTGAVSIPWQKEMIESGLFDDLNKTNGKAQNGEEGKSKSCVIL